MDCNIQLKLQLLIELECMEEGRTFFGGPEVNQCLLIHCNVSLLDAMMRKTGFKSLWMMITQIS